MDVIAADLPTWEFSGDKILEICMLNACSANPAMEIDPLTYKMIDVHDTLLSFPSLTGWPRGRTTCVEHSL
eukprot:3792792-Amphidinium_carterae.1